MAALLPLHHTEAGLLLFARKGGEIDRGLQSVRGSSGTAMFGRLATGNGGPWRTSLKSPWAQPPFLAAGCLWRWRLQCEIY